MNIRNCRNCGRIFNYIAGAPLCQSCREENEAKFQEVKAYLREHVGIGIKELAEACDVEASQIQTWLREERLEVTEHSALYLNCESCGAPIRCGRYCDRCKGNMTRGFQDAFGMNQPKKEVRPEPEKKSAKMRFL